MQKLKISCCLALLSAALTLFFAYLEKVTVITMFTRSVISFTVFAVIGFVICVFVEHEFTDVFTMINEKGNYIDVASKADNEEISSARFSAFTPDEFEHIASKKSN